MDKQKENFERLVRSHKDTIYTVCYMFSKDERTRWRTYFRRR